MINLATDIHSLTDFKRRTTAYIEQIKKTGQPLVLTLNGKAELVVQDAASYQKLLTLLDRVEAIEGIQKGLKSVAEGRTRPAEEVLEEMRRASMKYRVDLASEAEAEIKAAYAWIAADSPEAAARWRQGLL